MMKPIVLKCALFRDHGEDPDEHARSRVSMLALLSWLTFHDRQWLKSYPGTPAIYDSGVKYIYKDSDEAPAWQDIATCLGNGTGDCKDFAAWRCAELLESGVSCKPVIQWRKVGDSYRFHALVEYPDGRLEDPSKALGMVTEAPFITPAPAPGDNMNPVRTADAVVRGLLTGDEAQSARAKDTVAKLKDMAQKDPEAAKCLKVIHRVCAVVRQGMQQGAGEDDVSGLIDAAFNPPRRKSVLTPTGQVYREPDDLEQVLGLNESEEATISTSSAAVMSLVPGLNLLAPLTPLAVKGANDLITRAQNGDQDAKKTIADTATKAKQGDPGAKADLDALKRVKGAKDSVASAQAQALVPSSWWPWDLYKAGVGPTVH